MAVDLEQDLQELKDVLDPINLDFDYVDLEMLREMRKQESVQYVTQKLQLDEEIQLASQMVSDLENIPEDIREEGKKWLESKDRDETMKPKDEEARQAITLFAALNSKRAEVVRVTQLCEFHLKLTQKYDGLIEQWMKAHPEYKPEAKKSLLDRVLGR